MWGHLSAKAGMSLAPSATLHIYFRSIERLYSMKNVINTVYPAHDALENAEGYTQYTMPAEILAIYYEGIREILDNSDMGEPYYHAVENGRVKRFRIGGIVYDPKRMDMKPSFDA